MEKEEEWLDARDAFWRVNGSRDHRWDFCIALQTYIKPFVETQEEASWLVLVLIDCRDWREARDAVLNFISVRLDKTIQARGYLHAYIFSLFFEPVIEDGNVQYLIQAAKLGNSTAQAHYAEHYRIRHFFLTKKKHTTLVFDLATRSILQNDRHGWYVLGWYYKWLDDKPNAVLAFKQSAKLGYALGIDSYASLLYSSSENANPTFDPENQLSLEQLLLFGKAARKGREAKFWSLAQSYMGLRVIYQQQNNPYDLRVLNPLFYALGLILVQQPSLGDWNSKPIITMFTSLYSEWSDAARAATFATIWCLKQVGLHKDVVQLVAKLVWDGRMLGNK
jgi:hypothetical protein